MKYLLNRDSKGLILICFAAHAFGCAGDTSDFEPDGTDTSGLAVISEMPSFEVEFDPVVQGQTVSRADTGTPVDVTGAQSARTESNVPNDGDGTQEQALGDDSGDVSEEGRGETSNAGPPLQQSDDEASRNETLEEETDDAIGDPNEESPDDDWADATDNREESPTETETASNPSGVEPSEVTENAPLPSVNLEEGQLWISELMPNPDEVSDTLGEYVEVWNRGSESIALNRLTIRDDGGNAGRVTSDEMLEPGGIAVLGRTGSATWPWPLAPLHGQYGGGVSLNNGGDIIELLLDDEVVDTVVYARSDVEPGVAAERISDEELVPATDVIEGGTDFGSPGFPPR